MDLIAENYYAAIGGGFDLVPSLVSRTLAPVHVVAVASSAYMPGRTPPVDPSELAADNGISQQADGTRSQAVGRKAAQGRREADDDCSA